MSAIRVLVVEDSLTVRKRLIEILAARGFEVIGEAADGRTAIALACDLMPDVITLDLELPDLDGLAVTEAIMARAPRPILIVSSSHERRTELKTYDALAAGAVDVIEKRPDAPGWEERFVAAVRIVSRIKVIMHPRGRLPATPRLAHGSDRLPTLRPIELVALGASSGGPRALARVLSALPADFALPIAIVLHVEESFARAFAEWLADTTARSVRFARDHEPLAPGVILAPPHHHLVVSRSELRLSDDPPRHHWRPSIDVLFESIAAERAASSAACLLTGMGRDGASGLLAIRSHGGLTIAQDEATSVVFGMPREAIACGAATHVLPLDDIGPTIRSLGQVR